MSRLLQDTELKIQWSVTGIQWKLENQKPAKNTNLHIGIFGFSNVEEIK